MKNNNIQIFIIIISVFFVKCKKNTLVEVVDVPSNPIEITKSNTVTSNPSDVKAIEGSFEMYKLPYNYKDLEPLFDPINVEIHYSKHHLGYVNNLNKLIVATRFENLSLEDILKNLKLSDTEIRFNAGGFYNHNFFWESIAPNMQGTEPDGDLKNQIIANFGSFDNFRTQFTEAALKIEGSGWVWLISDKSGNLKIVTTTNNDSPLMKNISAKGIPLLTLDMWEHSYYLKYQNRKREYVNTFFSMINWAEVTSRYNKFEKIKFVPKRIIQDSIAQNIESVPIE